MSAPLEYRKSQLEQGFEDSVKQLCGCLIVLITIIVFTFWLLI